MAAERDLTNRENVYNTHVEMSFNTQHSRIPIAPAILAAIHMISKSVGLLNPNSLDNKGRF